VSAALAIESTNRPSALAVISARNSVTRRENAGTRLSGPLAPRPKPGHAGGSRATREAD
jgi:hypothetical protein